MPSRVQKHRLTSLLSQQSFFLLGSLLKACLCLLVSSLPPCVAVDARGRGASDAACEHAKEARGSRIAWHCCHCGCQSCWLYCITTAILLQQSASCFPGSGISTGAKMPVQILCCKLQHIYVLAFLAKRTSSTAESYSSFSCVIF